MKLQKKKKWIFAVLAALLLCIVSGICMIFIFNTYSLELSIPENTITLEYGVDELPKITGLLKGSLINRKGTPVEITMEGNPDLTKLGSYHVTYKAVYQDMILSEDRTIVVADTIPPVIDLVSDPEHFTSPAASYEEEGFQATDNYDGDLTAQVIRKEENGIVTYTVTDSSGNKAEKERTIIYKDVIPPAITLLGKSSMSIQIGQDYSEPGFTAEDDCDGDLTSRVVVDGSVDTKKTGSYTLTYTVTDEAGNTAQVTRTVSVYRKQTTVNPENPGNKVVYLTFDDGPGKYTAKLLDILDKYGVKVTFFVTNQYPAYQNMIGEAHRRGHTIALHTYSHVYSSIYSSEDAYYSDLARMNDVCVQQTGVAPTILRFPGGTNNLVSQKYCNGIMTALSNSISSHGYLYSDWNVSSGDAGGTTNPEVVASNVIAGIQKHSVSIVLQHDIKSYSVDAVEKILTWGLENGYTFLPMSESTPMVHFKPQN